MPDAATRARIQDLLNRIQDAYFDYNNHTLRPDAEAALKNDATTLGGNSGSVVLVAGREHIAAGLHYGGRGGEPRENWGHILGLVLDEPDASAPPTTLREQLKKFGVTLLDRHGGGN